MTVTRREVLAFAGAALLTSNSAKPQIQTVTGSIPAEQMGFTLPHEHVMCDFIGATQTGSGTMEAGRSRCQSAPVSPRDQGARREDLL